MIQIVDRVIASSVEDSLFLMVQNIPHLRVNPIYYVPFRLDLDTYRARSEAKKSSEMSMLDLLILEEFRPFRSRY